MPLFSKTKRQHKLTRRDLADVAPQVAARNASQDSEDDEDIFSVRMRDEREAQTEEAVRGLVGGDTASFRPLRLDEEEDEAELEGDEEESQE